MSDEPTAEGGAVRRLDEETVARIAAGEVVSRPASVVKELLENALDAGAREIDVDVETGGFDLIRVADDGHGMAPADAELAVERHTTSKLSPGEDVRSVASLGFRGEALPSIATVAHLELVTRAPEEDAVRVVVDGTVGDDAEPTADGVDPAARGVGTTVTVRDLFAAVPARRKALATARREFAHVSEVVTRYALVRPDVAIRLTHDGERVLATPGSGDHTDALLAAYDREVAGQSTAVGGEAGDVSVSGVCTYPSITRSKPSHVAVAVNGRSLADSQLRAAVVDGYGGLLPSDRYPIAAIDVSVPPERIDQNVHPSKAEVGFHDGAAVQEAVTEAVREALATADLRRSADVALDLDASLEALDGDAAFEDVTVLGQFRDTYLLCADADDLLVVDQHAAHERVNYERLQAAVTDDGVPSSPVDPPATVSLSAGTAAAADAHREALADLGYEVAPFGGRTYRVSAVPAPLGRAAAPESVRDVLDRLADGETVGDPRSDLLADLACHPSLKAGDALAPEDARDLLDSLGACEQPYACPHGRPTTLSLPESALQRGFERHPRRE